MSAIIFTFTSTNLIPVTSNYYDRQQISVNKVNRVSDLILGRDDKGNETMRSAMKAIKHTDIFDRVIGAWGLAYREKTIRRMTFTSRPEG